MFLSVFIPAAIAVITGVMAYLGVHVTLHPANESPKKTRNYKRGFVICWIISVVLVACQGVRNYRSEDALRTQLSNIQKNTESPPHVDVNVPPPQVIIEHDGGGRDHEESSFLQIKTYGPATGENVIAVGQKFGIAVFCEQKGNHRLRDVRNSVALFLGAGTQADENAQQAIFRKNLDADLAASRSLPGATIGVGQEFYDTAESPHLTQAEVDAILSGSSFIYVWAWSSWQDDYDKTRGHLEQCMRLLKPSVADLSMDKITLQSCAYGPH